jgi:hypothetical protein
MGFCPSEDSMKFAFAAAAGLMLVAGAAQAAPQLKPGLWTITTTARMANMPQMPPEVMAMMKAHGMSSMPGQGQPITTQICLTGKEKTSAADIAAQLNETQAKCTPRVVNQTANSASTEIVCHGMMEGTGHATTSWQGDTHYQGDYSFKGTMHGMAQDMQSQYVGNWVKADCGAVKPLAGQ